MMTIYQIFLAGLLLFNGHPAPFQPVMLIQENSDYENQIVQTDSAGHFVIHGRSFGQQAEWRLMGKVSNDSCEVLAWKSVKGFDTLVRLDCDISTSSKVEITWRRNKEIKHPCWLLCWPDSINGLPAQILKSTSSLDTTSFYLFLAFPCRKEKNSFYLPAGNYYFLPMNDADEGRNEALYRKLDIYYFEANGTMLTKDSGGHLSANVNSPCKLKFYVEIQADE